MTLSDTYCTSTYCIVHCISYNFIVLILHDFVSQFEILQAFFFTLLYEYDMICNWPIFQTTFVPFFKPKIDQFPKIALHLFSWTYPLHFANHYYRNKPRTTDTQWRHKSKKSENLGRCGRQNMLRSYLKIWEWEWIFGRAVKAVSSLGVLSPWCPTQADVVIYTMANSACALPVPANYYSKGHLMASYTRGCQI